MGEVEYLLEWQAVKYERRKLSLLSSDTFWVFFSIRDDKQRRKTTLQLKCIVVWRQDNEWRLTFNTKDDECWEIWRSISTLKSFTTSAWSELDNWDDYKRWKPVINWPEKTEYNHKFDNCSILTHIRKRNK